MKLKYYLRGLGIGIVLATMILVISRLVNPISNEEVIRRAEALGMVTTEADTSPLINPTTSDSSTEDRNDASDTSNESKTEAPSESETTEAVETTQETETTQTPTTETPTTEAPTTTEAPAIAYTIQITNQMGSESVAYTLQKAGIISSAEDFNEYLIRHGYEEIILSGTFTVTSDMSYEQIARKICGR